MSDTAPKFYPDQTLKTLLIELILKAKLEQDPDKLDDLIMGVLPKITAVGQFSNQLVREVDVVALYPRLFNLTKLRNYRSRREGPPYIKTGPFKNSRIYYRISDIEKWITNHENHSGYADPSEAVCQNQKLV